MSDVVIKFVPNLTTVKVVSNETTVKFPTSLPGPQGEVGPQGPTGPQGPAGSGGVITVDYEAGENLSAGRVVIINGGAAYYFQPSNVAHAGLAYGVTVTSATAGNDVTVQLTGEVTDVGFTFAVDSILWATANGEITDVQPTGVAVLQKAGVSSGAIKMKIDLILNVKTA